ncbi:Golgi apparatus membrane protein TVP38 [Vanrija pseudolonga]|uniref:Golgi apparatus membrane protein TVP38 n=1 Tax=Vanrija pseudolonga TaxID=143232 RepID=A0AAF1BMF3_9TREE|nr:Golgi apparatus membrane protein TVP38 [Vanrija pseudolonga]
MDNRPPISHPYPVSAAQSGAPPRPTHSPSVGYDDDQLGGEHRGARNDYGNPNFVPTPPSPEAGANKLSPLAGTEGYPDWWTMEDEEAERQYLQQGMFNWKELRSWRFWFRKEWWYWYLAFIVISVLVILMVLYHDQIVHWLMPAANWMKNLPGGWAIPIAVLFIISFPPLFGHEIVAVLCGVVWGLWIGFGIVCAGTFIGEIGNYYAFKYCCRARAEKIEKGNMNYACLSYVMREGSIWLVIAARLSAIPGHFTTAVFATCGMNIWVFCLAAFVTLPKQLITVYLGVIFAQNQKKGTKERIISYTVLCIGFLLTIGSAWWIYHKMHQVRVIVWRQRRVANNTKGIAMNSLGRDTEAQDDEDIRPILRRLSQRQHGHPETRLYDEGAYDSRQSYVNPYDIHYKRNDDMSVYHVDAMSERVHMEQDIGNRIHESLENHRPPAPPTSYSTRKQVPSAFPEARPHQGSSLRRDVSSASAYGGTEPTVVPSSFPVPAPAPYNPEQVAAYKEYTQQHEQRP